MNRTYNRVLLKIYKVAIQSESTIATKIIKSKNKNKRQGSKLDVFKVYNLDQ